MARAQQGDRHAYGRLLAKVEPLITRYLSRRISVRDDVPDVTQNVLLSLHKARHTYQPGRPFTPWLYAICYYRLQDYLRSVYRDKEDACDDFSRVFDLFEQSAETQTENRQFLERCLSHLGDKQRMIIERLYLKEQPAQEVAEALQISVSDVRTTAHRAMKRLNKHIEALT